MESYPQEMEVDTHRTPRWRTPFNNRIHDILDTEFARSHHLIFDGWKTRMHKWLDEKERESNGNREDKQLDFAYSRIRELETKLDEGENTGILAANQQELLPRFEPEEALLVKEQQVGSRKAGATHRYGRHRQSRSESGRHTAQTKIVSRKFTDILRPSRGGISKVSNLPPARHKLPDSLENRLSNLALSDNGSRDSKPSFSFNITQHSLQHRVPMTSRVAGSISEGSKSAQRYAAERKRIRPSRFQL